MDISISIRKKAVFIAVLAATAVVLAVMLSLFFQRTNQASAVKASDFNAGRIIDDAVFYNSGAMTASQIQTFLDAKNPNCDTNGTGRAVEWGRSDITRATLASYIRNGTNGYTKNTSFHAPPYTCMRNFKQNTPQVEAASGLCSALPARSNRTAAQIIDDVAKACGINPQVLLVLLEKEQSLVTDIWPLNHQYNRATGFACPDNAGGACDSKFNGFFRQVYSAARQFQVYKAFPNNYNYSAGRTNNIFWQTNGGNFVSDGRAASRRSGRCGYSQVYIQNQATAALYVYTPYRPNQAALNNHPGTGDACSAYGNRNFWFMFSGWFGSTQELYGYRAETLVGDGGVINRPSIQTAGAVKTLTIGQRIFTFYDDAASNSLKYVIWDGRKWTEHTLDGAGSAVPGSLTNVKVGSIEAFTYKGQPQVYYYDALSKTLRHAYMNNSGNWGTETLDGSTSGVIKRNVDVGSEIAGFQYTTNAIQLYYYNNTDKRLEHTWWDGKIWRNEVLDGSTSGVIKRNVDVGSEIAGFQYTNNAIQLYYYNTTNKRLEHTWWDGRTWRNEVLDGEAGSIIGRSGDIGSNISGLMYNDAIQLFYHKKDSGELIHTWWNKRAQRWSSELMDGDASSILGNHINAGKKIETAIINGRLFLMYYDDAAGFAGGRTSAWRLAYWNGSTWIQHVMDGGENSKSGSPAAMPLGDISASNYQDKSLQLFYRGNASQLRHFWVHR